MLGVASDPFGEKEANIIYNFNGIVIGRTNLPLVNEGDALFHIARFESVREAADKVMRLMKNIYTNKFPLHIRRARLFNPAFRQ